MNEKPAVVVSGSFEKFKREVDLVIEEFEDHGMKILAPKRGPLLVLPEQSGFFPLQHELHIPRKKVEDDFLRIITKADFLYVVNIQGYMGTVVSMEMGAAIASGKPIYLKEPASRLLDFEGETAEIVWEILKVKTPTEVAKMAIERKLDIEGYYWCAEASY